VQSYKIIIDSEQHKFSSSHFIIGHEKCGRIHGHNFTLSVEISGPLDETNYFVVDFIDVKNAIKDEIDKLDHRLLIPTESKELIFDEDSGDQDNYNFSFLGKKYSIPKVDTCLLPLPAASSEMLARHFYGVIAPKFEGYKIRVRIGESGSSFAEYGD
jgi:6-pyruvoyltetrahydropterin/6-carboxytetrahydropterin synthase